MVASCVQHFPAIRIPVHFWQLVARNLQTVSDRVVCNYVSCMVDFRMHVKYCTYVYHTIILCCLSFCIYTYVYRCDNSIRSLSATYDKGEYVESLQPSEQTVTPDYPLHTAFQHVTQHQLRWNCGHNGRSEWNS